MPARGSTGALRGESSTDRKCQSLCLDLFADSCQARARKRHVCSETLSPDNLRESILGSAVQDSLTRSAASLSLYLGVTVGLWAGMAPVEAGFPEASFSQWRGALEQHKLADGSTRFEYGSSSEAFEGDVHVLVAFLPRFECRPIFGFRFTGRRAATSALDYGNGGRATLLVDEEALEIPLMVDLEKGYTTLWLHLSGKRQAEVLGKFDRGSNARLGLSDGVLYRFSLLGSMRSALATRERCERHEAEPYDG